MDYILENRMGAMSVVQMVVVTKASSMVVQMDKQKGKLMGASMVVS